MRNLKLYTIFFSAIMLFNCGEDSSTGNDGGGGNAELEVTVDNIVGTWEMQSQSWSQNVVTNQDVTFASECVAGTGSIDIAGDITASLTYLEFSEYSGMIEDIQVGNEGCYEADEPDAYVEIEIDFIGNVANKIDLWYDGDDNYYHFFDMTLDNTNYSLDGLTLTLNIDMTTTEYNYETSEWDTLTVNISGTLTAGTITAAADQSTVLISETETPEAYEHPMLHLLEDGTMTFEEEIDCPLITEDDECQWNGCVWTETDGVGSCGDFTLTCSELPEAECYEYYGSCWWDYYEQLCYSHGAGGFEETWSLGNDDTFIYVSTETSGNETYSDTMIMDISLTSSNLTLSFSQDPCGSNSYYGYYMEMMCEYYGFSDEECLAMCYEGIAEEFYGLDGNMVVSFEQSNVIVLTRVEALSRVLESAQFRHYINKINRYQLAKGMARLYMERARTQ